MAVTASIVPVPANTWTLAAQAVAKQGFFSARNPNAQCWLIPVSSNTAPTATDPSTIAAIPFTGTGSSVVNDDGGSFWFVYSPVATSIIVWKV